MKKTKRLKKPKLPKPSIRPIRLWRKPSVEERVSDALSNVPRITNETLGDHREEVLSSARKYIYPLKQSKHRVVRISVSILLAVIIVFFAVCTLALYKFQSTSTFIYDVSLVVPFPVAKVGNSWVSYESYLFELRHDIHYYQHEQHVDFSSKAGKEQLVHLKQQALAKVIQDAQVKQLAAQNGVSVSNQALNNEITLVRVENRLGNSDEVLKEVLSTVYGWNENDFKRELKQQLLQQAVVAKLDTATAARAQSTLQQIDKGASFATIASQVSDDLATKATGGQYPNAVTVNDSNISPIITAELFKLKPGQISNVINTGYTLEILKTMSVSSGSITAAHIQFNLQGIDTYLKPLQKSEQVHQYIHFKS
jgi:parvulin-like peptidyl-prolyl isomerase